MKHKNQHFVPRSYLEAWCDPDVPLGQKPYVWIVSKDGAKRRNKAPVKIFSEKDMYTIHLADGTRDLSIETGLSGLEDAFARLRRTKLAKSLPISSEDRAVLCAFMAAMQARTRKQRGLLRTQFTKRLDMMKEAYHLHTGESPDRLDGITDGSDQALVDDGSLSYYEVKRLAAEPLRYCVGASVEALTPILMKMHLTILSWPYDPGFITSDSPCVWFDPEARKRQFPYNRPFLDSRTLEIRLPISPRQLAVLSWRGGDLPTYVTLEHEGVVDEANRHTRACCHEHFVVCRDIVKPVWLSATIPTQRHPR